MKQAIIKVLAIAVSLLSITALYAQNDKPKVEFVNGTINLGTFTRDSSKFTVSYKVKNAGGGKLVFYKAKIHCSCMSVDLPKKPLAPGKTGEIIMHYDGSKQPNGKFNKEVSITTNSEPPYCWIALKGEMVQQLPPAQKQQPETDKREEEKADEGGLFSWLKKIFS